MKNLNTEAVVLAAGLSTRTKGKHKMLLKVNGKTLLENCVDSFRDVCSKIIVVTGFNKIEIVKLFENDSQVETVFNENFKMGMFSSVKCGISKVNSDKFFFTPGDYPNFTKQLILNMLTNFKGNVLIPTYNGRKGHPVIINGNLKENILNYDNEKSMKDFINETGFDTLKVDNSCILHDVDTLEDYKKVTYGSN